MPTCSALAFDYDRRGQRFSQRRHSSAGTHGFGAFDMPDETSRHGPSPMTQQRTFLGWPRNGWILTISLSGAVLGAAILTVMLYGTSDSVLAVVARNSVRAALVLFALTFSASSLHYFFPGAVTRWLVAHRPYLGVAFAIAHLSFLSANIARVILIHGGRFTDLRPPVAWIVGGAGYVLIVAMAATSFPGPRAAIGRRAWNALHVVGGYAIALAFLNSYGTRAFRMPEYFPLALVTVGVLALRGARVWHWCWQTCRSRSLTTWQRDAS